MIPKEIFLTRGVGRHTDKLVSFELALRDAGVEKCNLVCVSSIFPPRCEKISREKGVSALAAGAITYCVMARNESNTPGQTLSAAIGLAAPRDAERHGYLSEYHAFNETEDATGAYAEKIAAEMLATILNARPDQTEDVAKNYQTENIAQAAVVEADGNWTTVLALAVFAE